MSEVKCYISSDNDIVVKGLRVARTGAPANAATVTASLLNSAGSAVSSSSTTLDYVTNSLGTYFGSMSAAVVMTKGDTYTLKIVAAESGKDLELRFDFVAGYYQGQECAC
jgi:hypothetical protein